MAATYVKCCGLILGINWVSTYQNNNLLKFDHCFLNPYSYQNIIEYKLTNLLSEIATLYEKYVKILFIKIL